MLITNMEEVFKLLLNDSYSGDIYLNSKEEIQVFRKICVLVYEESLYACLALKDDLKSYSIYIFLMKVEPEIIGLSLVTDENLKKALTEKMLKKIDNEELEKIING